MNGDTVIWLIVAVFCAFCYPGARRLLREVKAGWANLRIELAGLVEDVRADGLAGLDAAIRLNSANRQLDRVYLAIDRERRDHKASMDWMERELAHVRKVFDQAVADRLAVTRKGRTS